MSTSPPTVAAIEPNWQRIVRRDIDNDKVRITLADGRSRHLHRFALAGKNDCVQFGPRGSVTVRVPRVKDSVVVVSPPWTMTRTVTVFRHKLMVTVKEIETADELNGYHALVHHHYRTGGGATRRALLIATTDAPDLPPVVGFVEVCSSFLVNVPRKVVLDAPFSDTHRGIRWTCWDMDTAKKYTNATARISRCVVYPELRGIGVAGILAQAATRFALERWHIGGLRPSFLEITAEMLRYWPFVEKAGFLKVGETEGNGNRLEKAMTYLLQRKQDERGFPKGGGGILTMYRAHATLLQEMMNSNGWTLNDIVARLKKSPDELPTKDWVALHALYRRPKPVYMLGLTPDARCHLHDRLGQTTDQFSPARRSPETVTITAINVRVSAIADNSVESRQIQEAFNIVAEELEMVTTTNLNMDLKSGEVILVTGASGNGKSLLLRTIAWYASGKKKRWQPPAGVIAQAEMKNSGGKGDNDGGSTQRRVTDHVTHEAWTDAHGVNASLGVGRPRRGAALRSTIEDPEYGAALSTGSGAGLGTTARPPSLSMSSASVWTTILLRRCAAACVRRLSDGR